MQPVQTLTRFGEPFDEARTRWMFGFQRRFVRRWECDTDMPHEGPCHTLHTLMPCGFSCTPLNDLQCSKARRQPTVDWIANADQP